MSRTNIDIDDELAAEVMRRFGLTTKRAAVDLALRRLVGSPLSREFLLGLEGVGWEGDLDDFEAIAQTDLDDPHRHIGLGGVLPCHRINRRCRSTPAAVRRSSANRYV
ncbi:type II toxin-antitoxin system VapB family antitoxin [Mycobacterium tuberculosis]